MQYTTNGLFSYNPSSLYMKVLSPKQLNYSIRFSFAQRARSHIMTSHGRISVTRVQIAMLRVFQAGIT